LDARHAGERLGRARAILDEEGLDEVVGMNPILAHESADRRILAGAAWTPDEIERWRVGGIDHVG
jgi:hypothetical protein